MIDELRRQREEAWNLLGAVGFPTTGEAIGEPVGQPTAGGDPYVDFVNSLAPLYWRRFRETSGTSGANSGSLGGNSTWSPGTGAVGQTGLLGANEAYSWDGANSLDSFANNAAMAAAETFSIVLALRAAGAGEGNIGVGYCWGNLSADHCLRFNSASRDLVMRVDYATNANTVTNETLDTDTWYWLFATYDVNGDRRARIYRAPADGTVTQFTYAAQIASVGAYSQPAVAFNIGAIGNNTGTWNGLFDEALFFNYILTTDQMQRFVDLT